MRIAFAIILLALLTLVALHAHGQPKQPLIIDASLATTPQDQLFTVCPLMPRNLPRKIERNA